MNNELDTIKIGKFIAEQRHELGLTQQGLAERLSVTNRAVSKWETGQGTPDIGSLTKLAEILQVTVDEILKGEKVPISSDKEEKYDSDGRQAAFIVQTSLSRYNQLLCAKACWQSLYIGLRLVYLSTGIVLLVLAFAGAGISKLTVYHISPVIIALSTAAGIFFVILSVEGYRLLRLLRNCRTTEEDTCTFHFMDDGFSIFKKGMTKSWRYEHVDRLLETNELLVIFCGREYEYIKKQTLPSEQLDAIVPFLQGHCLKAVYRNLSTGRAGRIAGLSLFGATLLLILFQAAYLAVHAKYKVEYQAEWIPFLINFLILAAAFLCCIFLAKRKTTVWIIIGILCWILFFANIAGLFTAYGHIQDILSFSPNGQNELVLKRDTATGKVVQYRYPFLFLVRPYQQFPYTADGRIKTQWLTGDTCTVTYVSEQGGPAHQYVATFDDRGRSYNYYVEAALDGSWEPAGQYTAGWQLVRDTKGIVLSNGSTEYDYNSKDCVQYGMTTLVLCRSGLPQWTVVLNEDCKIDPKTLLVSYGGTLTLCQVSMNPTAPLVFRSTSKSLSSGSNTLTETSVKDTYRVQNGTLSFTWDSGHRWTAVPLPKNVLNSILKNNSTTKLMDGSFHIADDFSYLLYGRAPLTALFTPDQGRTWETHQVANLADNGIDSRFITYTSIQTAVVAVGLHGTPDIKGSMLYTTKDGGMTWQNYKTPSTQTLTGMNFLNQDIGYMSYSSASGASGELYETMDGGNSFTKVTLPDGNLAEVGGVASGLTFQQVYDTPQVPFLENGIPVLFVTQGSDGDFGNYRARYKSKDGGKTWQYVSQEKLGMDSNSY